MSQRRDPTWDRWEEVDRLLAEALDEAPEEREALLRKVCDGDEELLRTLRGLLRAVDSPGNRLDGPGADILREALSEGRPGRRSEAPGEPAPPPPGTSRDVRS